MTFSLILFMKEPLRSYLSLHFSIVLFGFTAILGAVNSLNAIPLVWWRILLTVISLGLFAKLKSIFKQVQLKNILFICGTGIIVSLHWLTFYGSIKASNASVGVLALAATPLFTAFLEPLVQRRKINIIEVLLSFLIIPGMILIANTLPNHFLDGFLIGIVSAFLAALFSSLNQKMTLFSDAITLTFLELGSGLLVMTLCIPFWITVNPNEVLFPQNIKDWLSLILLALLCTSLAYSLTLHAMKKLSAFTVSLSMTLEPLYGIGFAWLLLNENEQLTNSFYWGSLLIILSVFIYPVYKFKNKEGKIN
jgi:drug/metabolite transporter (DMT)-like permease